MTKTIKWLILLGMDQTRETAALQPMIDSLLLRLEQAGLPATHPSPDTAAFARWYLQVVQALEQHVASTDDFFALVSDGNMSLIRAVEKFDYSRGNKFSTYASWAIMKNFARTIPSEFKHRDRFRTTAEELFLARQDDRLDPYVEETVQRSRQRELSKILNRLDEREQKIITARFGLARGSKPLTLKQVGEEMGVTKERIRQLEARALSKLREAADEAKIDVELGS